jgi:hypothetical protein
MTDTENNAERGPGGPGRSRRGARGAWALVSPGVGLGLVLGLGGCVSEDGGRAPPVAVPPAGAVVASPFSPAGVRVLPLTHFERTAAGETRVLLFFELRDQWGDTVKGAGALEVRVSAESGPGGPDGPRVVEWSIDLADLSRNAALYDPSTRAYRLALKDLPGWLAAGDEGVATLEVYFRTLGSDGRPVVLRDRFPLGRPG